MYLPEIYNNKFILGNNEHTNNRSPSYTALYMSSTFAIITLTGQLKPLIFKPGCHFQRHITMSFIRQVIPIVLHLSGVHEPEPSPCQLCVEPPSFRCQWIDHQPRSYIRMTRKNPPCLSWYWSLTTTVFKFSHTLTSGLTHFINGILVCSPFTLSK